jgi:Reverse transcriptase (RNA-dependent DNA polymerase)
LSIGLSQGWSLHQLDVNNAFLHGDLEETVYMEQPPGFVNHVHPYHVCKLKKAIYGLKRAPRAWFSRLKFFFQILNFSSSQSDPSLFILNTAELTLYLLVYVDDIIITGTNSAAIQPFCRL